MSQIGNTAAAHLEVLDVLFLLGQPLLLLFLRRRLVLTQLLAHIFFILEECHCSAK